MATRNREAFGADNLHADLTFYENGMVPTEWDAIARFRDVNGGGVAVFVTLGKPETSPWVRTP